MGIEILASGAITVIEEIIKLEPGIEKALKGLFSQNKITPQDWDNLRARVLAKSYQDYVPKTKLPPVE